ncbi:PAS domain-containing protein [Microvirga roseola]|uniref:PAS domain-containing protein n=1 Tax=Microvirga roseola TaxID=2883126 RepID=UPI0022A89E61|nr:PAS domain-containing protein [Microvirga roseola]
MSSCAFESHSPRWKEDDRLAALRKLEILDTPSEAAFDEIATVAARVCNAPMAIINFIDEGRQWFKSELGLGVRETPVDVSICAYAILKPGLFVVPDMTRDPRFSTNPLVTGEPHLRFYAGAPLETDEGLPLGTLCVLDHTPRPEGVTREQGEILLVLARAVMSQIKLRQANRVTAENERRYRALVEASATIVWRALPNGSIIEGSPEWEDITGQNPGAFKDFGWLSAIHPDDCERVVSHWHDVLASCCPGTNEFRVRHVSGDYRWFATRAVPILNPEGTVREWVGTITDIHEQKLTSERLHESEERYRALVDASAAVVWRASPDGAIVEGSGWETFCGQNPESFKGLGWLDNVHPEDRESVMSKWRATLASQQPGTAEYRIRRLDGEYRWSLTRAVPLLKSDGTVQEWIGAITDIHEQKAASECLQQREEQHRALLEASSVVLWLATPDGMITETRGWQEITGQDDSETAGLGSVDTIHPDDQARITQAWKSAVLLGLPYENECRVRQKNGTYRWMLTRAVPLRNPDGSVRQWVGGLSDVHNRKQAEEMLRASEEWLRLALKAGRMAVLELDLRTNVISRRQNTIDLLGIESSSLSDFMMRAHPDDQHKREQFFSDLEAQGASSLEFRYTLPDGQTRWFKLRAERTGSDHVVGLIFDVTEAKNAEDALANNAALLRATLENMDQGLIMADTADRVTVFNRRALDLLDLPFELMADNPLVQEVKAFQENMGDIAPEDDDGLKVAQTSNFLSDPIAYERTRSNGTVLEVRTVALPGGGAVRTYTDITARRRAESELRASEERLRLALQAGRMVAWEQDLTTNYITRSQNSLDLLGIGSGPLSEFLEKVHPEYKSLRDQFLAQIKGEGIGTIEFRYQLPSGKTMWLASRGEKAGPNRVVGVSYDISERKAADQELWRLANYDPLTSLPNRSLFQRCLEDALSEAKQKGRRVSLLLIDLDDFKDVNDSFGHDAGDALLREVAVRLSRAVREGDTVARLGGDEFALLFIGDAQLHHAVSRAEGITRKLGQPFSYAGLNLLSRASIGVASYPDHHAEPAELMKDADIALYRAKADGRNRVVAYSPSMRFATEQRVALRRELREAISLQQVVPYYQPKVSLTTGAIVGLEALARWHHPTRGLLTASSFGEAFDDPELAALLGKRLIGKVAADVHRWHRGGLHFGRVAINLSHAEFIQSGLADDVLRVLDLAKVPPKHFEIEITERVLLNLRTDAVASVLEKFRIRGVHIALDDFGTGYASLAHLKQFPVDHLKIDRSFVRDIEQDPDDEAIVAAVVSLGRSLNLEVTAEGVETIGQAQRLREMGCGNGQGYLYARPLAGPDVPDFLLGWAARLIPERNLRTVE